MSKVKKSSWTLEQEEAIYTRNSNVIVSAGAGSGKTAVLTERVYQMILEGIKIDELVVLTFTNAAAFEMRERIRDKLSKDEKYAHLVDEVDSSYIMTFDAFALALVKRYHYLLELGEDISISEDSLVQVKKYDILDQILEEYYAHPSSRFLSLLEKYVVKSDKPIRDLILKIDKHASLKIDREQYLSTYIEKYFNEEKIEKDLDTYFKNIIKEITDFSYSLNDLEDTQDVFKMQEALSKLIDCSDYDDLVTKLLKFRFPSLPKDSEHEEEYTDLRNSHKEYFNNHIKVYAKVGKKADVIRRYLSTKDDVDLCIEIIQELDSRMNKYKQEYGIFTFSDIAILACKLLDYPLVRSEIVDKVKAIMVDEYQDTSDIQEEFLNKIARNNLFMVGDVKQSIYRFRNANCTLFMDKYVRYQKKGTPIKDGLRIDLNKNFRSRHEVLDDINEMFSSLMTYEYGGAFYKADHIAIAGNKRYLEEGNTGQDYNIELNGYNIDEDNNLVEARLIAQDILSKIGKYDIFDKGSGLIHKATYNDFAILIDRGTKFDVYKEVFEEYHIPLKIQADEKITTSLSVRVLKNLLRLFDAVVNNKIDENFSFYFASIYRSFLYQGEDLDLERIILENRILDTELYSKVDLVAQKYKDKSLSTQVMELLKEFDFERKLILVGDLETNEKNIEYLLNSITTMEKMGFTINDFLVYLDNLDEYEIDIKSSFSDDGSNAVRLLTIHKSKGLEYPVVYYSGLSTPFNTKDISSIYMTSLDYGIILPVNDDMIPETMYHFLARMKEYKDDLSEKIRLFYVGLTRAKEKMIAYYPLDYNPSLTISSAKTMLDFIYFSSPKQSRFHEVELKETSIISAEDTFIDSNERIEFRSIDIPFIEKETIRASNELHLEGSSEVLELGTNLHFILELIDFNNPNFDFITDLKELRWVKQFFESQLYIEHQKDKAYHEYSYYDEENDYNGIIDLLLVGEDATIIDFKTSYIDEETYRNQLLTYAKYVRKTFKKDVKAYLYSIIKGEFIEVDVKEETKLQVA